MDDRIRGKRIVVLDDEHDLTIFYGTSLEYYGFEVETYSKSENALSRFKPDIRT
jgi:DNA-binding response OmpR family regulator